MRRCTALRQRSASVGPPGHRYATERRRNPASPILPPRRAPAADDELKIDTKNKTIDTAVGKLPLSPILDPTYWEAVGRHQQLKPKPGKAVNSLERQFRANPFAQALGTPLRYCSATRTRQPKFFLQDFSLVSHPENNHPWWIPRSLISKEPPAINEENESSIQEDIAKSVENVESTQSPGEPLEQTPSPSQKANGPSAYVLANHDLIASFVDRKSGFGSQPQRLFGPNSSRYTKFAARAVWRQDMDRFILDLMRQDIVGDLLYMSKLCEEEGRHYIVKCFGWDDVQHKIKGAVLWFGESGQSSGFDKSGHQPGPFATFDIEQERSSTSVVVHNMPMLLGPELATKVKLEATALRDGDFFMLARRRTSNLQLKLWKLQGYLSDNNY
ncbi:hypothetical protein F5Y15DRAFT_334678 [Xylariaceae sp. FL0016]|nr:hypothetical protein F5Y15DRAFT_334678 [Xylariaceae sp. FL0016]